MATSSRRSSSTVLPPSSPFQSSGPIFNSTMMTSGASNLTSSSIYHLEQRRSTSPSRVHLHALSTPPSTPSIRFAVDGSVSPRRSIAATPPRNQAVQRSNRRRTCLCSPTTHPGSFRCALHRNIGGNNQLISSSYSPNRLNMRRSAMTNSLVRIGTVEGELMKRALAALIRPSSHQLRRRSAFQPRLSRLSVMSRAEDLL